MPPSWWTANRCRPEAWGPVTELGLRFVHQDLGLVPALNVIDNLALTRGYRTNAFGKIDWRAEADLAAQALADIGLDVDPFATVESLSLAEGAGVAIARAVHDDESGTTVLVLDEPTAALPPTRWTTSSPSSAGCATGAWGSCSSPTTSTRSSPSLTV